MAEPPSKKGVVMSKLELVIVLAAGDSKRMKSDTSKVLHEIAGRSVIQNLLAALTPLSAKNLTVVVGAQKEAVTAHLLKIAPMRHSDLR